MGHPGSFFIDDRVRLSERLSMKFGRFYIIYGNSEFRLPTENGGPMGGGAWTAMTSRESNMEG